MDRDTFRQLLRQVRDGDHAAAATFVHEFEPALQREVRLLLTDERLRRLLTTSDICQSAFALFFLRYRAGQFDLESPEQLFGLLAALARNRLRVHRRRQQAGKRDQRLLVDEGEQALARVVDPRPGPGAVAEQRDLLERLLQGLPPDVRSLARQRALGRSWPEIAAQAEASPEALRKQLDRALDRAVHDLGLEEPGDE